MVNFEIVLFQRPQIQNNNDSILTAALEIFNFCNLNSFDFKCYNTKF